MVEDTKTLQIKSHFDDFEEFTQTVQGWGLKLLQVDCGEFEGTLRQIRVPGILLNCSSFNRQLIKNGNHPEGMRSFGLMAEGSSPYKWQNQDVTRNCLIVVPKGAEIDSTSAPGFNQYTLSFSEHFLLERLQQWDDQACIEDAMNRGGLVESSSKNIQELRHYLNTLFSAVKANPSLITLKCFQDELYNDLPHYIFNILNSSDQKSNTAPFFKRAQLIKNIEPWLLENLQENHLITEICKTFDVNERTLLRIYKEKYGVSTKRYLLALRLNMARKELVSETFSRGKIAVIANRWGFWHMGDFARVYRRQFGELPTETLHKRYRT